MMFATEGGKVCKRPVSLVDLLRPRALAWAIRTSKSVIRPFRREVVSEEPRALGHQYQWNG